MLSDGRNMYAYFLKFKLITCNNENCSFVCRYFILPFKVLIPIWIQILIFVGLYENPVFVKTREIS